MRDHTDENKNKRVLSGMRPTGKLHLGNYVGALQNWVSLQHQYECFFFIADWHALTTDYEDTSRLAPNTLEVLLDWLAAGLDPNNCTMFAQSHVIQHAELHVLFSMITPLGWLERVPTYKEQQQNLNTKDLSTYGFLGYPLLQAADILIYLANFVPVGEDQVAHVELTREVARRFNSFFPKWGPTSRHSFSQGAAIPVNISAAQVFPEPQPLLTQSPKLLGIDGRKMSKSYQNSILLSEEEDSLREKIRISVTDRPRLEDPGNPDKCSIGNLHQIFSTEDVRDYITVGCKTASIKCIDCKALAFESVNKHLRPIREKRRSWAQNHDALQAIMRIGAEKASQTANETMKWVRQSIGLLNPITLSRSVPELHSAHLYSHRPNAEHTISLVVNGMHLGQVPTRNLTVEDFAMAQAQTAGIRAFSILLNGVPVTPDIRHDSLTALNASQIEIIAKDARGAVTEDSQTQNSLPILKPEQLQGLSNEEKGEIRRNLWLETISKMYPLRDVGHRTYVTTKNRRVGISTSGEIGARHWHFSIGDRHYDVLVIICHFQSGELIDFVVPRNHIKEWKLFPRDGKNVSFEVRQINDQFYLGPEISTIALEINQYFKNYRILAN